MLNNQKIHSRHFVAILFIVIVLFTQLWYVYPVLRHPKLHYWAFLNARAEQPDGSITTMLKCWQKAKDQVSFETNIWANIYIDIYGLSCTALQKDTCGGIVKLKNGSITGTSNKYESAKGQEQILKLQIFLNQNNIPYSFVVCSCTT